MRRYRPFLLLGLAAIIAFTTSSIAYRWLRAHSEVAVKPALALKERDLKELVPAVEGGVLFGSSGTVLFTADEATLKDIDPMLVRLVTAVGCFGVSSRTYSYGRTGRTLGELFAETVEGQPKHERKILQVVRAVSGSSSTECAAIWFAYVEQ
jgi:hypothetical protein